MTVTNSSVMGRTVVSGLSFVCLIIDWVLEQIPKLGYCERFEAEERVVELEWWFS